MAPLAGQTPGTRLYRIFTFRTQHCLSPGKMALTRTRDPAGPFPHTPGPPHQDVEAGKYLPSGETPGWMPRRHRAGSFPVLPFSCGVSGIPAGQRAGHRDHAQQPRHQARLGRFLGLRALRARGALPLLVGDERPGGRPRGDGHGPLAVSGKGKPEQFGRGLLMHTGSRGIVRHGSRRKERFFPGVNPPAIHEENVFPSPDSGRIRFPPAGRHFPHRGHAGPRVRYRMVLENVALTAIHLGGLNARGDAINVPGCESFPGIRGIQPQIQPALRGGRFPMPSRLPRSDPALGDGPRPGNRNCNQNTGRNHSRKATGPADIAFAPELQPAPISPRS